ncbi:MAG: NUDIX hydrolase [Planctomycetota bacterium]|jgi:hypothetical protein
MTDPTPPETPQTPETLYDGQHLRMVRLNGWEYVHRPNVSGIVGIVPITDDGRLVFIEQHRPPLGNALIEWPAGRSPPVASCTKRPATRRRS